MIASNGGGSTMENLPSVKKILQKIDGLRMNWFTYSQEKRREFVKCRMFCQKFDKSPEYLVEKITPGWTLVLDPEDMIIHQDLMEFTEEERRLPKQEFLKLVLLTMWWNKLYHSA